MSWEMKNAWMVLTISMEMYSEMGTMFWKAMRQELDHTSVSGTVRFMRETYTKVITPFRTNELVGSAPCSYSFALVEALESR